MRVRPEAARYRELAFWAGLGVALAAVVFLLGGLLLPIVAGVGVAYAVDPAVRRLRQFGFSQVGASSVVIGFVALVIVASFVLIVPILIDQVESLSERFPTYLVRLQSLTSAASTGLIGTHGSDFLKKVGLSATISQEDVQKAVDDFLNQSAQFLGTFLKSLWQGGAALVSVVSLIIVTPIVAFYMLLSWDKMILVVDGWLPLPRRDAIRATAREIDAVLSGFIRGQLLVCFLLGCWYTIGLTLVGLDFSTLIGIYAGLLSFIPYLGSLAALVVSAAVALVQGWPHLTLLLLTLAVVFSGQFLEGYVLSPKLVGKSVRLHPIWLMVALFAFGGLIGFVGLVVAVPTAATLGVLMRLALRQYLRSEFYLGRQRE